MGSQSRTLATTGLIFTMLSSVGEVITSIALQWTLYERFHMEMEGTDGDIIWV